eukprot:TRINITY_DN2474_c0_g1_i3.p1 TRINITY_DN2474_c0_g1~~TRINITY_DN2474_c0_g1_i3.p1  ORF type:complete len:769 (+),score=96.59 TRINITY_DN2474_c0_g1_i3:33-2339(+)
MLIQQCLNRMSLGFYIRNHIAVSNVIRLYGSQAQKGVQNKAKNDEKSQRKKFDQFLTDTWPKPYQIVAMTSYLCSAEAKITDAEQFFIKSYGKKKEANNHFESWPLFENWKKEPNENAVLQFLMSFEKFLSDNDKVESKLARSEYICFIWRYLLILEASLDQKQMKDYNILFQFSKRCTQLHSLPDIEMFLVYSVLRITEMNQISPVIFDSLRQFIQSQSYHPTKYDSDEFPRTLQNANYKYILERLAEHKHVDRTSRLSFLFSLALYHWGACNYSIGLDYLSKSTQLFLEDCNGGIYELDDSAAYKEICDHFCRMWSNFGRYARKEGMEPAMDYIVTQAKHFQAYPHPLGFLPTHVILSNTQKDHKVHTLLQSPVEEDKAFVKALYTYGTHRLTERLPAIYQFLQTQVDNYNKRVKEAESSNLASESDQKEGNTVETEKPFFYSVDDGMSGIEENDIEIQKELLDIKLIQLVVRKNGTALLNAYFQSIQDGIFPNEETVQAIAEFFMSSEDEDTLEILYRRSPATFIHRNHFYLEASKIRLRTILQKWQSEDEKLQAWQDITKFYNLVLKEQKEDLIDISTADNIVRKCRQICKLFIEDNLLQEKPFLAELRREALNLTLEHRDVYLLLALWEALFFSTKFEHQEKADKLVEELPQLVQFMKIEPVIERAEKYGKEELFRKLIEVNLSHNGTDYNKSRSFEALLNYLTLHGRVKAGYNTINTAKALNIRITSDYMADFLEMCKARPPIGQTQGFLDVFRSMFRKRDS